MKDVIELLFEKAKYLILVIALVLTLVLLGVINNIAGIGDLKIPADAIKYYIFVGITILCYIFPFIGLWIENNKIINGKSNNNGDKIMLHLNHRASTQKLYQKAFESRSDVLILSIMSQHSIKEIGPLLEKAKISGTRVRVLTFNPNSSPDVIESIRILLQENNKNPKETIKQIENAFIHWQDLAKEYPNIELKCYNAIPSVQGIFVKDKYIMVELMTYATNPSDRLGFVLMKEENPTLYEDLYKRYDSLWLSSIKA